MIVNVDLTRFEYPRQTESAAISSFMHTNRTRFFRIESFQTLLKLYYDQEISMKIKP